MRDNSVKLGDFCVLSYLKNKYCGCRDPYGSLTYMAPEVFEEGAGDKSDVWSFGVTLIELAECKHPYGGLNRNELMQKLLKEPPPSLSSEEWASELADFVSKCLVKDVNERWSVRELLEHPFIRSPKLVKCDSYFKRIPDRELEMMKLVDEVKEYREFPSMDSFVQFDSERPEKPARALYCKKDNQLVQEIGEWIAVVDTKDKWMKAVRKTWLDSLKALREDLMDSSYEIQHKQVLTLNDEGERWEGDVMGGQPFGWGVLYDKEGEKAYEGFRIGDVSVCYGTQYYADIGVKEYEGEWCEGKRWGRGIQYDRNGDVMFDGEWMNDEQICSKMIMRQRTLIHNHITELVIWGAWTKRLNLTESFFSMIPQLESLTIGDICFSRQEQFTIKGMKKLKRIKIGNKCFKRWDYFYGCHYDACFCVADCPQLLSIEIGNRSFLEYGKCEFKNLPSLEWMKFGYHCFQWASLELRDLPRLKSLEFSEKCFCCCRSLVLEDLPDLESIQFDMSAFCFYDSDVSMAASKGHEVDTYPAYSFRDSKYDNKLIMRNLPKLQSLVGCDTRSCSFRYVTDITLDHIPNLRNVVLPDDAFEMKKTCYVNDAGMLAYLL